MSSFVKDPQATLDYAVDWEPWLGVDTIQSVTWTVDAGITQANASNTTTSATIWLSGGTVGTKYKAVCRVTTAAGRIDERTIYVEVRDK